MKLRLFCIIFIFFASISFAAPLQISNDENDGGAPSFGTTNVYIGTHIVMKIDDSRTYYFSDYLGSTRIVTDETGQVTGKLNYAPFGKKLVSSETKYTFTGKEQDSTGLQYFGARYYDPDTGRFTQLDPIYIPAESAYEYVKSNPMKYVDPNGKARAIGPIPIRPMLYAFAVAMKPINDWMEEHQNDIDTITFNLAMVPVVGPAAKGVDEAIMAERAAAEGLIAVEEAANAARLAAGASRVAAIAKESRVVFSLFEESTQGLRAVEPTLQNLESFIITAADQKMIRTLYSAERGEMIFLPENKLHSIATQIGEAVGPCDRVTILLNAENEVTGMQYLGVDFFNTAAEAQGVLYQRGLSIIESLSRNFRFSPDFTTLYGTQGRAGQVFQALTRNNEMPVLRDIRR